MRRDPTGLGYDPDILRSLDHTYGCLLAAAEQVRRESHTLPEFLVLATIVDEIASKRTNCQRRLAAIEAHRHTQARRELLYPGAGRSPAVEGQGCPASAPGAEPRVSAVGPAAMRSQAADITESASPLFAVCTMQGLPVGETPIHTQPTQGETHDL